MCDGKSLLSWTISSARSVSTAWIPAASSASFSSISWVAIDLTLTTSVTPVARTTSVTTAHASAASRAQCTTARAGRLGLEPLQQLGQASHHIGLDRPAGLAQRLPVGHLGDHPGPLVPYGVGRPAQVGSQLLVAHLAGAVHNLGRGHDPLPFSARICA